MHTHEQDSVPRTPVALVALTVIVIVAGFATVAAWFALLFLGQPGAAPAPRAISSCSVCGVVEGVAQFERAGMQQLNGDRNEAFVVLLAALGGMKSNAPAASSRFYETAVLHDDGSVRIVRDTSEPLWKRG